MIKKTLSAILAALAVFSTVSCFVKEETSGTSVTASAGTEKYITLFEGRVEEMPDSLVLATGDDAAAYGVDVSEFVDDEGYTVRANGGEVVILGKTDAALDRAVRHFTAYGNYENYTFTYGEEYRVQSLTVMGCPIEDFAVVRPDDADEAMRLAADELVRYIRFATGVTLPTYTDSAYAADENAPAHRIALMIDYPTHGDEAFTIDVKEDGNIDILCGRYRGGLYGVYGLLYDIGWRFLGDGTEYVYEAESVDLTEACDRTEEAAIANRFASDYPITYDFSYGARINFHGRYVSDSVMSKYGFYGVIAEACHGLDTHNIDWQGTYGGFREEGRQPCFTNEDVLQAIDDHYRAYIKAKLDAGCEPGRELCYVDAAQFDTTQFCQCQGCIDMISVEGATSGAVLRMTNRVADIAAEYDPEIYVLMLAYAGTNKAPKVTTPRDNVKISYCFYIGADTGFTCSNHSINDETCRPNSGYYEEFEEWKEICSAENLQVWYYPLNCYEVAYQVPCFDTAFADMKYLIDSDINCIMFCEGDNNDKILLTVLSRLVWDADMTEEEYWAMVEEYFDILYGESGEYIYEYTKMLITAGDLQGCWCAFHTRAEGKANFAYLSANFDYMMALFETALKYAETEEIAARIEVLMARMMYICINATHEDSYVNGTDSERALFEERYTEMHRLFKKHSIAVFDDYINYAEAPDEIDFTKTPTEHWCIY